MERYDLALMLYSTFSSSAEALAQTLDGVVKRLEKEPDATAELNEVKQMLEITHGIATTAKYKALIKSLDICFRELKRRGANKKALIFTASRATQKFLKELLVKKWTVATYSGDNSGDNIIAKFRDEAEILITTDLASDGLNFEFCSLVVNYDIAYNTLKLEQRIDRCHRLRQQNDVIVISLINRNNFADVRMLELVGKRTLLMDGVFGLTDDVIGGFISDIDTELPTVFEKVRTKQEVAVAFADTLTTNESKNKEAVESAEEMLFTTFSGALADNIHITPQYIESKTKEINEDLWCVVRWFFGRHRDFMIDDENRSIRTFHNPAPHVFTGTRMGRDEYSMLDKTLPKSGWITITSNIAQNVLQEIFWQGLESEGSIIVDGNVSNCTIGFYEVTVSNGYFGGAVYRTFTGQTQNGKSLSDRECRKIMEMPVLSFSAHGNRIGRKDGMKFDEYKYHELDDLIDTAAYTSRCAENTDPAIAEEISKLKHQTEDKKIALNRDLEGLKAQLTAPQNVDSIAEKLLAEKRRSVLDREYKQKEQSLFMDGLKLDVELEEQIKKLADGAKLTAKVRRLFLINVEGGQENG